MNEKFEMFNLVNYFMNLSRPRYCMLLDWFSDLEKIEIPYTGDENVAYSDGNLFLDRAALMEHLNEFYIYQEEMHIYGDVGINCPMGLSHAQTVKVLEYLWEVNDFIYWFEGGFFGYGESDD